MPASTKRAAGTGIEAAFEQSCPGKGKEKTDRMTAGEVDAAVERTVIQKGFPPGS
jgi:hypothetical protein